MPNIKSAAKQMRQSAKRRVANRGERAALRTTVKKIHVALEKGDAEGANALLNETISKLGKAAQKGIVKKNNASRHISRLTRRVHELSKPAAA